MKLALALLLFATPLQGQWLDPDNCWTCQDSKQHFVSGALLDTGFHAIFPRTRFWERIGLVTLTGVVWEFAQADVARSANLHGVGCGFGFKDLALDMAGALVGEVLWKIPVP